jgi:hypothetical protein
MARTHSLLSRFAAAFAQAFGSGRFSFDDLFAVHGGKSPFFVFF